MNKIITKIDAFPKLEKKLKVAAYCRVSSGKDTMLHSLANQVSYYNNLIQMNPSWEFAGIYADEAISGTRDTREEFNRLIKDCKDGKIDLVIVKSISRFARNTLTMLETIRELKKLDIDVFFEEQNLHTLSSEGEMVLTFLASFAQEEARSVSENMKWKVRKNYEQGLPWTTKPMYGYRFINKKLEIVPEEAKLVKRIFDLYLDGLGIVAIANLLNEEKVKPMYAEFWKKDTINNILSNINYTGDMLLQKFYSESYLTKKRKKNKGELNQYLVENDHEPIISKEVFCKVQELRLKRAEYFKLDGRNQTKNLFAGLIKCGVCESSYIHKTTKYTKKWICSTYNHQGKKYCASKAVPDDELRKLADEVVNGNYELIKEVLVYPNNRLVFTLFDGTMVDKVWKDITRKDSWTPEMKEKARQRTLENGTSFKKGVAQWQKSR